MGIKAGQPLLTVCCGLPGSGKSTWARGQAANTYVLTADAVRTERANAADVFDAMHASARRALRAGVHVVVDACSLDPRNRMAWLQLGRECSACVRLVVFTTPLEVCRVRDAARPATERAAIDWQDGVRRMERVLERIGVERWDCVTCIPHEAKSSI